MCDVKKYFELYEEVKELKPEDVLQLTMEADSAEQKDFFEMIGNYLLQQKIYFDCRRKWRRQIYFVLYDGFFKKYAQSKY